MKQVMWLVVIATVVLVATPAWTACPVHPTPGLYATTNGTILPGRASEAWCAGLGPGVPGNVENGMSWDATAGALGSQWHVWDMTIDASGAQEVSRHFDTHGNGWIDYVTNYTGGQFWLTKNHTWSDGVNDLTGQLTYYNVSARVTYLAGNPVGVTSNIYFTGVFDQCPLCTLEYVITNAMRIWQTGMPNMPSDYPPFECSANSGELYNVCCIQASIYCPVSTNNTTWGLIKELYK